MEQDKIVLPEPMRELTDKEWEGMGFTRAQFQDRWQARLKRDEFSPKIGTPTPDFELELLSSKGDRTGDFFQLSSLSGSPIGLIFGSYT